MMNIKKLRLALHLSPEYMSKRMEISKADYIHKEEQLEPFSDEEYEFLSQIFGYTVDELKNGDDPADGKN